MSGNTGGCNYNSSSGQLSISVNSYYWIIWNFCSCYCCSSSKCDRRIHKHLHWVHKWNQQLTKTIFAKLAISSYKIADQSELISHTLATGLWRLLKYTTKPVMICSDVVTCTWYWIDRDKQPCSWLHSFWIYSTSYSIWSYTKNEQREKCKDSITGVHAVKSTNYKERSTCIIFAGTIAVYFTENNNVALRT